MHPFAHATGHKPGRDHSYGRFSISDFVSYDQGHLHFHFVPIIGVTGIFLIICLGIWAMIFPDLANKPISRRLLLAICIIVAGLLSCLYIACFREAHIAGL